MLRPSWLPLVAAVAFGAACSRDGLPPGADTDVDLRVAPAPPDLASPRADLDRGGGGDFCGDPTSARIELNGQLAASPFVSASPLYLNCCFAAQMGVVTMQLDTPITVTWTRSVGGGGPDPPVTLDLARLPLGWSVFVASGCLPEDPNCTPTDRHIAGDDSDLTGTLTVTPTDGTPGGFAMTACLTVAERASEPHPVIHALRFWTPPVTASP